LAKLFLYYSLKHEQFSKFKSFELKFQESNRQAFA